MDVVVGRLDFATKLGPLKVLSLMHSMDQQQTQVDEMRFARKQKSDQLKRYKPLRKMEITQMVAEVQDLGNDMSKDDIQCRLRRIH